MTASQQSQNNLRFLTESETLSVMQDIGIPLRYLEAKREDIEQKTWSLTDEFRQRKREGLFIFGAAGTGKTHLAVALLKSWLSTVRVEEGLPFHFSRIKFISVPELLLEIRKSFNSEAISEEQIITKYTDETKILILDDLGAEKTSEWVIQTLYLIVDRRYRNMQRTIITSNLSLGEISDKLHDRIASRIIGMSKIIELKGKDKRLGR